MKLKSFPIARAAAVFIAVVIPKPAEGSILLETVKFIPQSSKPPEVKPYITAFIAFAHLSSFFNFNEVKFALFVSSISAK